MKKLTGKIQQFEFEARMYISLTIVFILCMLSLPVFRSEPNNVQLAAEWLGLDPDRALTAGFLFIALLLTMATLLRMWAGSLLNSHRIMAFKVQRDVLVTSGAFALVRHPIYLADMFAYCAFALCLKPVGLTLPFLIYLHYWQLIDYEEKALEKQFGQAYRQYKERTPRRLCPAWSDLRRLTEHLKTFRINYDGFRNNAQYLLFIPGYIVAAFTGHLIHALVIGLLPVLDWAIIHTYKGLGFSRKKTGSTAIANEDLTGSKVFADVLYAQCWEDPTIDRKAFRIGPDDVVFSITSGGCNLLAFLIDDPQKVIALDLNPAQNHLLDLKMAAFRRLTYEQMLEFFGVVPSFWRRELYLKLRPALQTESRQFWDHRPEQIKDGIIHCGRYESYMHLLRKWFTRLLGKDLIRDLFATQTQEERERLYETRWNNVRWRIFTRVLLSRPVMSLLFTRAFFTYLEESFSFGKHFRQIIRRAVTVLPVRENTFLSYILLGNYFSLDHLPVYLQKAHFHKIRSRLDRIKIVTGSCEDYFATLPDHCISKFNFTNIFEWMPPPAVEALLKETVRIATDGAVLTYRNLLVPRSRPESLTTWIKPQPYLSEELHAQDLSFIYKAYIVETVHKKPQSIHSRPHDYLYQHLDLLQETAG